MAAAERNSMTLSDKDSHIYTYMDVRKMKA